MWARCKPSTHGRDDVTTLETSSSPSNINHQRSLSDFAIPAKYAHIRNKYNKKLYFLQNSKMLIYQVRNEKIWEKFKKYP